MTFFYILFSTCKVVFKPFNLRYTKFFPENIWNCLTGHHEEQPRQNIHKHTHTYLSIYQFTWKYWRQPQSGSTPCGTARNSPDKISQQWRKTGRSISQTTENKKPRLKEEMDIGVLIIPNCAQSFIISFFNTLKTLVYKLFLK